MTTHTIDLHMHSYFSDDGQFTPTELAQQCHARGIQVMAIADHNCARANVEGQQAAHALGMTYIPAIEIDCTLQDANFHVLGYGIDYESADFVRIEQNIQAQDLGASQTMFEATLALGFQITREDMEKVAAGNYWKDSWTGEMFAEVLLNKPEYQDHPLLLPYRDGGERSDNPYVNFYWDFYSQGKPCYAEVKYPSLESIVDIIHKNKGQAVLAHPGINLKNREQLLATIIEAGIDGIEAFSSYHSPQQAAHYYKEALDNGLFVSCGSDYHGKTKPAITLGTHGCTLSNEDMQTQLSSLFHFQ